jgi:hypothetical protein
MNKLFLFSVTFAMLFSVLVGAETGHVLSVQPVKQTLANGDTIDLGVVGPGQKIELEISRSSNIFNQFKEEEQWDRLKIDDLTLPPAWISEYSLRYEANPKAFVIVDREAPDGGYEFFLYTERDYGSAGQNPVRFKAKVRVTKDVLAMEIISKKVKAGVDQPAEFMIRIKNLGSANDAFNLDVLSGLPRSWNFKKQVYVPHNSEKIVPYEVGASEQSDFDVTFKAQSLSSKTIYATDTALLMVRSDIVSDMKSVGNGVILFPYIEQSVYYLLGLIASNFM